MFAFDWEDTQRHLAELTAEEREALLERIDRDIESIDWYAVQEHFDRCVQAYDEFREKYGVK